MGKLNAIKLPKELQNIERALIGDVSVFSLFTNEAGGLSIPVSLSDGKGLVLIRRDSGRWFWFYRYRINGVASRVSLGEFPSVSLSDARTFHAELYKQVRGGVNPAIERKELKIKAIEQVKRVSEYTFSNVAAKWFENWRGDKDSRHVLLTWRRVELDLIAVLGSKPIDEITLKDFAPVIQAVENRAPQTAAKLWGTCGQIFRFAVANGILKNNILAQIKRGDLLRGGHIVENMKRVPLKDFPDLLRAIDSYDGVLARLGLKLVVLTFVRHGELRGAQWSEFDLENNLWIIPAGRMKMRTAHIVPLSRQALAILFELKAITGGGVFLFPNVKGDGRVMSDMTLGKALKRLGYDGVQTVHGFRGLASTILNEHEFNSAHIELQLAHMKRNKVEAAYNHAQYLKQRIKMMQWYADHLDALCVREVLKLA